MSIRPPRGLGNIVINEFMLLEKHEVGIRLQEQFLRWAPCRGIDCHGLHGKRVLNPRITCPALLAGGVNPACIALCTLSTLRRMPILAVRFIFCVITKQTLKIQYWRTSRHNPRRRSRAKQTAHDKQQQAAYRRPHRPHWDPPSARTYERGRPTCWRGCLCRTTYALFMRRRLTRHSERIRLKFFWASA